MKIEDSRALLADYVTHGTETAFRELVERYIDLVYSTALRLLGGDTHLAEDVSQIVFTALARKAPTLSKEAMLGGWLHRHTCYVASTVRRTERRRQWREGQAAQMNALQNHSGHLAEVATILDEAINQLGAEDRKAILLRFFEQLDLRSVGEALGSNEDAAQKRVSRALEKLHSLLKQRGGTLSTAGLGTALAAEAVAVAPGGLGASIAGAALAGAAVRGGIMTFLKTMSLAHFKLPVFSALAIVGVALPLVLRHQVVQLREENRALRQQVDQLDQANAQKHRLSNLLAQANSTPTLPEQEFRELLRLRGEVGQLRSRVQDPSPSKPPRLPERWRIEFQRELKPLDLKPQFKLANVKYVAITQDWYVAVCDGSSIAVGTGPAAFPLGAESDWTTNMALQTVVGFDLNQYWVLEHQTDLRITAADQTWAPESTGGVFQPFMQFPPPRGRVEGLRSIVEEVLSLGLQNVDLRTLKWHDNEFTASTITGHDLAGRVQASGPTGITQMEYSHIGSPQTKHVLRLSYDSALEVRGFPSTIQRFQAAGERPDVTYHINAFRALSAVEAAAYGKSPPIGRCLTNGTVLLYTNNSRLQLKVRRGQLYESPM